MINGIRSILVIFIILGIGYYFTANMKWPKNTNKVFSTTIVNIAAPALAIVSIENHFTPDMLKSATLNLLVIFITMIAMYLLGHFLSILLKLSTQKKAIFKTTFTFNNSMFIGLPINQIVFGDDGLPYLFTFYLVTITMFWSLGVYTIINASSCADNTFSLKKILSPGLIGVIIGCILAGTEIHLPTILETALSYLGNICVPLSLLVIGSNLSKSFSKGLHKITFDQIIILLGKFLIHPLMIFSAFSLLGIAGLPLKVFALTSSLPCHAQTAIVAEYYDVEGICIKPCKSFYID